MAELNLDEMKARAEALKAQAQLAVSRPRKAEIAVCDDALALLAEVARLRDALTSAERVLDWQALHEGDERADEAARNIRGVLGE